jgi:hypothetical protein
LRHDTSVEIQAITMEIKNPARSSGRTQIVSFNFPNNPSASDSSREYGALLTCSADTPARQTFRESDKYRRSETSSAPKISGVRLELIAIFP